MQGFCPVLWLLDLCFQLQGNDQPLMYSHCLIADIINPRQGAELQQSRAGWCSATWSRSIMEREPLCKRQCIDIKHNKLTQTNSSTFKKCLHFSRDPQFCLIDSFILVYCLAHFFPLHHMLSAFELERFHVLGIHIVHVPLSSFYFWGSFSSILYSALTSCVLPFLSFFPRIFVFNYCQCCHICMQYMKVQSYWRYVEEWTIMNSETIVGFLSIIAYAGRSLQMSHTNSSDAFK